jgi:uncharacterized protein YecE (DUF72 family)
MCTKDLYIGTSGWSYKHWHGIFYPENLKPDKYLEFYTTRFGCVELNSCFYHLPLEKTVAGWMNRTTDSFKFCPKLSRFITHQMKLYDIDEALSRFFAVFEGMKEKLGPILVQLPPGLSFDEPRIVYFLELLKQQYNQYRFAFEIRNKTWINDRFFDLLSHYGAAFVIADSGGRYPYYEAVTTNFVYLRLHGREQLYASDYSEDDLKYYAEMITGWLNGNKIVWVFFNNDYHGYAVKNADMLRAMLYEIK